MNTAKDPEIVIKEIRIGSKIYQVQDLFDLCGPRTLINRRSEPMSRLPKALKYSRQERRWQAAATLEEALCAGRFDCRAGRGALSLRSAVGLLPKLFTMF